MTKYIKSDMNGIDRMLIETDGNTVVNVTLLNASGEATAPTPEELQQRLALYMHGPGKTVEDALGAYIGSYESIRKADNETI